MRVRKGKKIWLAALTVFVAVFLFTFLTAKFKGSEDVDAANLANFDPGYIISDYQMGNYNSMSEAEIQAFLTSKNPCNNTNYNYYLQLSANRNYTWHFENGHFICLSEERFGNNDNEIGFQYGESAAHIIWQAAQDYRINPQVLIVLLQKETGLVTDKIPNNGDYRKATGYGCPDTAACSSKYYGFKNQIRNAASLFRTVLDGGWTNYPLGNNYIQYNPSAACGGSWVNIRSLATSALYRYTPYQPNASALAAGYGAGDSCGAYGNRNFYNYFEDWFGGITAAGPNYDIDADDIGDELKRVLSEKYESMKSELGRPASKTNCNIGHEGVCVKAFEKGILLYSPTRGVLESYGEVRQRHVAMGSIDGVMGFPVSGVNCNIGHAGACVQAFENGVIIHNPTTGTWESYGEIRNRHIQLATIDGVMGFPVSGVNCNIGYAGACVQAFENGVIIHNPTTGTWESYGEIKTRYTNNGSVDGRFGFPIDGVINGKISYQKFENGAIVKDDGGYWIMSNEILARYMEVSEVLGNIMTNVNCNIGHAGACVQAFENGVIIHNPTTGTWESYGIPRTEHIKEGSIDGKYGFPIGGVTVVNGVQKQKFQGGEL